MIRIQADAPEGPRPRPAREIHAELNEGPQGWVLTLHVDAAVARALGPAVERTLLRVSVRPNLVPGEPFAVSSVRVAVDDAAS